MTQAEIIKIIDIRIDMLKGLIDVNNDFNLNYTRNYAIAELEQLKVIIKYEGDK